MRCASARITVASPVGLRGDALGLLEALGPELLGFPYAFGTHPIVHRFAGLLRQIGAPHGVRQRWHYAEGRVRLAWAFTRSWIWRMIAARSLGEHAGQIMVAEHVTDAGVHDGAQLAPQVRLGHGDTVLIELLAGSVIW